MQEKKIENRKPAGTKKFTIGLAGAGLIARDHAITLCRLRAVKELLVFDANVSRASALAEAMQARLALTTQELVEASDIVWICTPPFARTEIIREACRQGKAVMCEKPLGLTPRQCREIESMVRKAGIPFFMGQSGRYSTYFIKMKELVDAGAIGAPVHLWATRMGWLDPKTSPPWRLDNGLSGGCVVELGVHEIDFIRWVGGDWQRVCAVGSGSILAPGKYQDTIVATGVLGSGATAHLNLSWASPRYLWQRGVEGIEGSLFFDDVDLTVRLLRPGKKPVIFKTGDWLDRKTGENFALRDQAKEVLQAFARGCPPKVTLEDGLQAARTANAMFRSALSGRSVSLK